MNVSALRFLALLSGFVVAVYAVVISGITLAVEDRMLD